MNKVVQYMEQMKIKNKIIAPINQMWLYKKYYLPCELVGMNSNTKTKYFLDRNKKSCIRLKFKLPTIPKLSSKTIKL